MTETTCPAEKVFLQAFLGLKSGKKQKQKRATGHDGLTTWLQGRPQTNAQHMETNIGQQVNRADTCRLTARRNGPGMGRAWPEKLCASLPGGIHRRSSSTGGPASGSKLLIFPTLDSRCTVKRPSLHPSLLAHNRKCSRARLLSHSAASELLVLQARPSPAGRAPASLVSRAPLLRLRASRQTQRRRQSKEMATAARCTSS